MDADSVRALQNDGLVVRLLFTVNHLSRWLTPVHNRSLLERTVQRSEPSVKDLLLRLRDEEQRIFPKMYAISTRKSPDLDNLPPFVPSEADLRHDRHASVLEVLSEFRRLRQSTCSLLRSLPNSAWQRVGISRRERNWTIRDLAEHLVLHDQAVLREIDDALERVSAREGIAQVSRSGLDELQKLAPVGSPR